MSPLVSLPYPLRDGVDLALGSEVLANMQAIVNVLHGIDYQNLSATPNFPGTCISSTAGSRIPTDRLEDDVVTADKLRDAALDVDDLLRAVTSDHIRLASVFKRHIASQTITKAQTGILIQSTAVSFTCSVTYTVTTSSATGAQCISHSIDRLTSGANYVFAVRAAGWTAGTGAPIRTGIQTGISPLTPLATANYAVLAAYLDTPTYNPSTGAFAANLITVAIPLT